MSEIKKKSGEQEAAEAEVEEFKEDLGPFVVAADTTRMPMVFSDAREPGNPIIFANDAFLALTGHDREEVLAQDFNFLMARGADPQSLTRIEAAFAGESGSDPEIRYRRKDGSEFWAAVYISPVRDEDGEIVQHFASFVDLTEHKQEQAQSSMLIDELNHRVKNTLATVQSIVWQALRSSSDPEMIRESIESRLFALSRSHDLLTRENWEGAGLHDLVNAALEPFGVANGRAEHFVIAGGNIRVAPNAALALGIAFHELATNAVKYGAFSNKAGSVAIEWTTEAKPNGERLVLCWREKGGPPITPPSRKGFGSRVIKQGLEHELGGEVDLDFRPDGLVCTIAFPVRGVRDE
ncbi:MAG: PAS domain-containing protein [Pseudaminobacter sp.]|nr:PAS domain-containing protein [Pseudaminobacter sp.]